MLWRIYYGDGSTYSDEDGSPFDAPGLNAQVIVTADDEHGRVLRAKCDFYWWTDDGWYGGDHFGLWDYLTQPGAKKVIFGRSLETSAYRAIIKAAIDDPAFPVKSAKAPGEEFLP